MLVGLRWDPGHWGAFKSPPGDARVQLRLRSPAYILPSIGSDVKAKFLISALLSLWMMLEAASPDIRIARSSN